VERRDNREDESGSFDGINRRRVAVVMGGGGRTGEECRGVAGEERLVMEAINGSWWVN